MEASAGTTLPGLAPVTGITQAAGQSPLAGLAPRQPSPAGPVPGLARLPAGLARRLAAAAPGQAPKARADAAAAPTVTPGSPPGTAPGKPAGAPPADDVPRWVARATEQLLTVTCWLDPGEQGEPFGATVRFTGRRADVTGKPPQPGDTFTQEEAVERILPGSGPVAITAEVRGINPGDWTVIAQPVARAADGNRRPGTPLARVTGGTGRVPWPRRVAIPADAPASIHTSSLLLSKVPGIIRYAYPCLVSLGVLAGLGLEALLLATAHLGLLRPMLFSVAAVAAGVAGGKAWYAAVHRGRKLDGWCIQGFVAGAALVVAIAALTGPGIPPGAYLAAAAPALLIGMGIGRHGCFWAGCCTGRPTAARWGIWSSDRRTGCRRAPVQLMEALTALIIGAGVLADVLIAGLARSGPVAVAGLAAYTLCRQFILGLRDEPRQWRYGRPVTAAASALTLIASLVLLAAG